MNRRKFDPQVSGFPWYLGNPYRGIPAVWREFLCGGEGALETPLGNLQFFLVTWGALAPGFLPVGYSAGHRSHFLISVGCDRAHIPIQHNAGVGVFIDDMKRRRGIMTVIAWILLGLIAGFIGSKILTKTGGGIVLDIVLGIVGALVGGLVFQMVGFHGVTGFNLWSLFVAIVGSVIVLGGYRFLATMRHPNT